MSLEVTVWPEGDAPMVKRTVHFLSFVTNETYGKPALVTEYDAGTSVLYVNPANCAAVLATVV